MPSFIQVTFKIKLYNIKRTKVWMYKNAANGFILAKMSIFNATLTFLQTTKTFHKCNINIRSQVEKFENCNILEPIKSGFGNMLFSPCFL